MPLFERNLTDCERVLGPDHPDTLLFRSNLAHAYRNAGDSTSAYAMLAALAVDCERVLGGEHPLTAAVRANLDAMTP